MYSLRTYNMHQILFLAAAALFVAAQASGNCSQRILTAEMLPGPDKWHELPDTTFEVRSTRCHCILHASLLSLLSGRGACLGLDTVVQLENVMSCCCCR